MALGYEIEEVERDYEIDGLTGSVVSQYAIEDMAYPCFILDIESSDIRAYQATVLQNLVNDIANKDKVQEIANIEEETINNISVYFKDSNDICKVATLTPQLVKAFLSLFKGSNITGYLDKNTPLKDDNLYVLSY